LRRTGRGAFAGSREPGDTRFSRRLSMAADVASVQFSRTVERLVTPPGLTYFDRALDGTFTR